MKKLKKVILDFDKTFPYIHNNLSDANLLSITTLKSVNFQSGNFFTLLPINSNLEKIYEFKAGGIANGIKTYITNFIYNLLISNRKISCIFDNVSESFNKKYKDRLFLDYGLTYEKEIYYLVTAENFSLEIINKCFYASSAIWHSLCVVSDFDLAQKKSKCLSSEEIEKFSQKTILIIVGAYDDEGYIFWEKKMRSNHSLSLFNL